MIHKENGEEQMFFEVHTSDYKLHKTNIIAHIGKAYCCQKTSTFLL